MKSAHTKVLIGFVLALAACSEGDRRFLLTYEHPKNERAAATMAGDLRAFLRAAWVADKASISLAKAWTRSSTFFRFAIHPVH